MIEKCFNKIMIFDGSYALHRALHAPGLQDLCTTSGIKSGGVFGSLKILQSELKKFPGYAPVFCFDKGLSKRRTGIYPDYKANRKRQSADELIALGLEPDTKDNYLEEYHRQRHDLIQILKSLGIPSLLIPGWEGDDLQYLVSRMSENCIVVSDDKDMIQLVSPTVIVRRSQNDQTIIYDESDTYYHHPHYAYVKSMCGDPSDNIPGVAKGLGGKGADQIASLIDHTTNFDECKLILEEYLKNNSKGAIIKKIQSLLDNWNQFVVNYCLTDLSLVEVPSGFDSLLKDLISGVLGRANLMKAYQLLGQYEMNSIYPDQIIAQIATTSYQAVKK